MKILITGALGQLGQELKTISVELPQYEFVFTDVQDLDISNFDSLNNYVKDKRFTHVINCAAYTAVDKCEQEFGLAYLLNASAPGYLAKLADMHHFHLIHISTDFIFNAKSNLPYKETETPKPLSTYGKTKYEGEINIKKFTNNYTIFRTSWLYSPFGNNFVKSMIKYAKERGVLNVVFDQVGTPTYAADLARTILMSIEKGLRGTYNYSNEGVCSWFDFAKTIIDIAEIDCEVNPIHTEEYPLPAMRPAFSVLDKTKIKNDLQIKIPYWRDSLVACIKRMEL